MSKKHFEAIAADLRKYQQTGNTWEDADLINDFKDLVNDLMLTFEDINPNFDRSRFISAIYD